jgi:hypothetical protein
MSKGTDKRLVREAAQLMLDRLGKLLESHRQREFRDQGKPWPRVQFCELRKVEESTVSQVESGNVSGLDDSQLRLYLAVVYGRSGERFSNSAKMVYDGIRELENLLKML